MPDQPASPFTRLDTSLLRSTRPQPAAVPEEADPPSRQPRSASPSKIQASTQEDKQDGEPDSMLASALADSEGLIQRIRKVVKAPGKEVSFVRLTADEKAELADLVYTYKRRGYKTSETEINRIAVNFILDDHKANGRNSILARVLDALIA